MTTLKRETLGLAAVICLALAATACEKRLDQNTKAVSPNPPSPSAVVIGQAPAEPSGETETPQTAPVDKGINWVSKPVEQNAMPLPGQPNDHSNMSKTPSQKAETAGMLESLEAAKKSNASDASGTDSPRQ